MYFVMRKNKSAAKPKFPYQVVGLLTRKAVDLFLKQNPRAKEVTKEEAANIVENATILVYNSQNQTVFTGQYYSFPRSCPVDNINAV